MRRSRDRMAPSVGAALAVLAAAPSASAAGRRFTIEAIHPAYAGTIVADRTAPDFRNCDMSADPVHHAEPRRVTIYETAELQLIGHTFPSFWRPPAVPVRV